MQGRSGLKKLVIKTAVITLASILVALAITFGAFATFAPRSLAVFFDGVGNYSASVFFYEKQYVKSQSFDDLVYLVDRIDDDNDQVRAKKYLGDLIAHKDFANFCENKEVMGIPFAEYYQGRYNDLTNN